MDYSWQQNLAGIQSMEVNRASFNHESMNTFIGICFLPK